MNKLTIFRIVIISFLLVNFIICRNMETEGEVIIMLLNTMFTIAYVSAEIAAAIDNRMAKDES